MTARLTAVDLFAGTARLTAVDLFAGTGWGVACKVLDIDEVGVEKMPEARATREANGMRNWLADVWDVLENADPDSPEFKAALLIASPPCQTFSMAGNGAGRKALDEVISLIDDRAYFDVANLREFGERHDMRTALVLTPLIYVAQHIPTYVVLEQVPTVLPVWERIATELRKWGYSVVTGVLNAEQYGVPQTRKRAILIARADGVEARMPTPTHSRYYSTNPTKLDEGVSPWVTMAEALGWGMTRRPYFTVAGGAASGGGHTGGQDPSLIGGTGARKAIAAEREAGRWLVANNRMEHSARRHESEPAMTIAGGHDSGNRVWETPGGGDQTDRRRGERVAVVSQGFRVAWRNRQALSTNRQRRSAAARSARSLHHPRRHGRLTPMGKHLATTEDKDGAVTLAAEYRAAGIDPALIAIIEDRQAPVPRAASSSVGFEYTGFELGAL